MYGFSDDVIWYSTLAPGAKFRSFYAAPEDPKVYVKNNEREYYLDPDGRYFPVREDFPVYPI